MKTKHYLTLTVFTVLSFFVNATTYFVRTTGADSNDGLTEETALLTLSKAIDKANTDGDVISISGTVDFYPETTNYKTINKSITIQGDDKTTAIVKGTVGALLYPIRIGSNSGTSILFAPSVTIENLTFKDFDSFNPDNADVSTGGVIKFILGHLVCKNVIFENNQAYYGGALSIHNNVNNDESNNTVLIQDCYFYNNSAIKSSTKSVAFGGAVSIYASSSSNLNVFDVTIDRCTFESNTAEGDASALRCRIDASPAYNKILVQNCTFVDNTNKNGGLNLSSQAAGQAVVTVEQPVAGTRNGEIRFINNTIAYNQTEKTSGVGGFLNDYSPIVTVINNIFYSNYNSAETPANFSFRTRTELIESRNNIVDGFVSGDGLNKATVYSGNTENVTSEALKLAAKENLSDNGGSTKTLSLSVGSVAIDGGYLTGAPLVDQRGASRIGNPDVGAYETSGVFSSVNNNSNNLNNIFKLENQWIVADLDCVIQVFSIDGKMIRNEKILEGDKIPLLSGIFIIKAVSTKGNVVQKVVL
jgi:hypothetical protein